MNHQRVIVESRCVPT